jgi:anthranilate synthase component 1
LNILIRTMVIRDDEITLRAGSGIVADSDPDAELLETRAKAKGLLRAIAK